MSDYFLNSTKIKLAKRIGKGGEGEVYTISEHPFKVAKIYTINDLKEREDKILAMIKKQLSNNNTYVSFPVELVRDTSRWS